MIKHVFLTGPPGVGKTTLIQKVLAALSSPGLSIDGFWTEEVRESGKRVGFDVVTVNGDRGILARVGKEVSADRHTYRVGQYVVDLPAFQRLALPLFRSVDNKNKMVFVIDEIGKMEFFSKSFMHAVEQVLENSTCSILGTIPISKTPNIGLVADIRARTDVKVFMVSKENRNDIMHEIVSTLKECLK